MPATTSDDSLRRERRVRLAVGLCSLVIYFAAPAMPRPASHDFDHFPKLARAFLSGRIAIPVPPGGYVNELIPSATPDAYYCAYPPLPAVFLMPFIALFGVGADCQSISRLVGAINVIIFDAAVCRCSSKVGGPTPSIATRLAFDAFFAFGTTALHVSQVGGDWHLAHAIALTGSLLALREFFDKNRPLHVGLFVSLVLLTRPTAAFGCLFCILPILRDRKLATLVQLAVMPCVAVLILGGYNAARFGSPFDFGYHRMNLTGGGLDMMQKYGQFHPHFVAHNFYWFFLAPPWLRTKGLLPIGFDPRGMSFFLATPAMVYCIVAIARRWKDRAVKDATISIAATLVPLLLYFNAGYWQFGHRFSMDYLAAAMLLVMLGMTTRPSRLALALIAVSVAIQLTGVFTLPTSWIPEKWTPTL